MTTKKIQYNYIHFSYPDFNLVNFQTKLIKNLKLNSTYSILIKIACDNNLIFKMCGSQIGLVIKDEHDLNKYEKLYSVILDRIESTELKYDFIEVINSIEIMYFCLTPTKELLLKNINSLTIPKQLVNIKKVKQKFNNKLLPLTLDTSYYGIPVLDLNNTNQIENDLYNNRNKLIELIYSQSKLIKNKDELIILDTDKLFIYDSHKKKYIILSKKINNTQFLRYIFDLDTGILIEKIKDTILNSNKPKKMYEFDINKDKSYPTTSSISYDSHDVHSIVKKDVPLTTNLTSSNLNKIDTINKIENYLWERKIGSVTVTIKDSKPILIKIDNYLNAIASDKQIELELNNNFGTFDIESFVDNDGLAKVYALGFIVNKELSPKLYYLTDYPTFDSKDLILKCIDDMLIRKNDKFIFYAHNFSRYDIIFIYNVLLTANLKKGYDYYMLNTTMKDNVIIRLDISIRSIPNTKNKTKSNTLNSKKNISNTNSISNEKTKDSNKSNTKYGLSEKTTNNTAKKTTRQIIKISFVDSLLLLNNNLDKLSKEFNVSNKKGKFPHSFVNRQNLNYIGNKPDISYYHPISEIDYKNINNYNWNLKKECLSYLQSDLESLLEILNNFSTYIFINYNTQFTKALTISRLALNIFKHKFYDFNNDNFKGEKIPLINKLELFNFIKNAYYGGITEVYKPFGRNLRYYDVNSLYPYVALNPMPGRKCNYIESYEEKGLDLDNLFGFFFAKVKTNNQYLGLLPIHKDNSLILPNGEFYGIWTSEELKFAKQNGYEITVIKGYNFNKVDSYFKDYILRLYENKKNSSGAIKLINKSLLNNLLGRFGLNFIKPITKTMDIKRRDYIFSTRKVTSHKILNEEQVLITYQPEISKEVCLEHGLDYFAVLNNESKSDIEKNLDFFKDVSIAIAAFTTAYARIFMNEIKLEILKKKGQVFYSDTDSIVTDLDLNLIKPQLIGKELGEFKLEYLIKESYFISNKTYCLVTESNETIIKTKGALNNELTVEDFIKLYWNKENIKALKNNTIINYEKASVIIEQKKITLNYDAYKKREKIFDENGLWVDTKPLSFYNLENK